MIWLAFALGLLLGFGLAASIVVLRARKRRAQTATRQVEAYFW